MMQNHFLTKFVFENIAIFHNNMLFMFIYNGLIVVFLNKHIFNILVLIFNTVNVSGGSSLETKV